MDLIARTPPPVGKEWTFNVVNIPPNTHSLTVELYKANGGIIRLFPRGRTEMQVTACLANPGDTMICAVARDDQLASIVQISAYIEAGNAGHPSTGRDHVIPVMGTAKPPPAFKGTADTGVPYAAAARAAPKAYGINIAGPISALVGEIVRITAQAGDDVKSVEFSASNADMGWMMPVPISGGYATAEAKMTTPGTAYIYGKFMDDVGNIVRELTHAIEVAAPSQQPSTPSGSTDLTSIINARTDAIMNRLKRS